MLGHAAEWKECYDLQFLFFFRNVTIAVVHYTGYSVFQPNLALKICKLLFVFYFIHKEK